jgi:hypothetical protein
MIDINKKYRTRSGYNVRILATDLKAGEHCIVFACGDEYEYLQTCNASGNHISNSIEHPLDIIEVSPYDHIKKGDLVLVWDKNKSEKLIKFFVSYDNNKIFATSYSEYCTNIQSSWDSCQLYQPKDKS